MLTPEQRTIRAKLAGHARAAKAADPVAATAAARSAFLGRWYNETDPNLPEHIRQGQAEHRRKQYMLSLALKSSIARSKRQPQEPEPEWVEVG